MTSQISYRLTKKARMYILKDLGYSFGKTDPAKVVDGLTWLSNNGHPLTCKLIGESGKRKHYEIAIGGKVPANCDYLSPHNKLKIGGIYPAKLDKAEPHEEEWVGEDRLAEFANVFESGFSRAADLPEPVKTGRFVGLELERPAYTPHALFHEAPKTPKKQKV